MRLQNKRILSIPGLGAIFTDKRWTRWGMLISERKWIRVTEEKHLLDKQSCKGRLSKPVLGRISEKTAKLRDFLFEVISN